MIWQEIRVTFKELVRSWKQNFDPENTKIKITCQLQFKVYSGNCLIAIFDDEDEAKNFIRELKS